MFIFFKFSCALSLHGFYLRSSCLQETVKLSNVIVAGTSNQQLVRRHVLYYYVRSPNKSGTGSCWCNVAFFAVDLTGCVVENIWKHCLFLMSHCVVDHSCKVVLETLIYQIVSFLDGLLLQHTNLCTQGHIQDMVFRQYLSNEAAFR